MLAFSQNVSKEKYNTLIDYINCKCTELSFKDQPRQPNLISFQNVTNHCDIRELDSNFYNDVLIKYLRDKGLFKNETLAKGLNTYKVEYKSNYTPEELGKFVVDTLMKQRTMTTFAAKHQLSYPVMESQIRKMTFEYFGYKRNTNVDATNEAETIRETNTFTDSTKRDKYSHLDGGNKANSELETDEYEESEKDYNHNYEEEHHKSFFEKYRTYLLLGILSVGLVLYWLSRFGGGSISKIFQPRETQEQSRMPLHSDFENIKEQLNELRITSVSLQEEMNSLRFRFNELESKVNGRYLDEPLLDKEDIEVEKEDFEVIDLSKESSSDDDILFNFDDVNQDAIDDNIDPNSTEYTGIGTTFFMTIPNENGNFDATQVSDIFKRPKSVYEFRIITKDGNQAEFNIHDDIATMIRALDNFEEYIKPACRSNAILHKNATKIITEKKGLALREGNSWRVVEKAIIRYT